MVAAAKKLSKPLLPPGNTADEGLCSPLFDFNSYVNVMIITTAIGGSIFMSWWFLLAWPVALFVEDAMYFILGINIFNTEISVRRGYQFAHLFLEKTSGDGRDLGFNLYDGDLTKSFKKSQMDKWDHIIKELNLKAGDSLLDVGCGYGDWLNYAKSKGINAVGVNITPEQAEYGTKTYGLEIYCTNWKNVADDKHLQQKLYNRFNAVTFMDTVEHYVQSHHRKNPKMQGEIYTSMFKFARAALKEEANGESKGRVFISCLHQTTRRWRNLSIWLASYLLVRYHSGFYPYGDDGLVKWSRDMFVEEKREDRTEDYRITALLDVNQFQDASFRWNMKLFKKVVTYVPLLILLDPHHLHKWADIWFSAWMRFYGDNWYKTAYNTEYRKTVSYVRLWWLTLRAKTAEDKDSE